MCSICEGLKCLEIIHVSSFKPGTVAKNSSSGVEPASVRYRYTVALTTDLQSSLTRASVI